MMRKACLFLILIVSSFSLFSQKTRSIILYSSIGNNSSLYRKEILVGGGEHADQKMATVIGIDYTRSISQWLSFGTGIVMASHQYDITYYNNNPFPIGYTAPTQAGNITLLSMPITLRADFLHYFFVTTGTIVDVQTKNTTANNQSGIGVISSLGIKYDLQKNIRLFVSPYFQFHGVVLFNSSSYPVKLRDGGIKIGIGYRF